MVDAFGLCLLLDLQVLLKEDDLIRPKIVCLLSYLGLLVLLDRLDRLGHRALLRAVRLSVHSRNQEYLVRRGRLDRLGLQVLQDHLVREVHLAFQLVDASVGRQGLRGRLVLRVRL